MSCTNCDQPTGYGYSIQFLQGKKCTGTVPDDCTPVKTKCVINAGARLPIINAETDETLESILIKIDQLLATSTGAYSGYNVGCLAPSPYTTEKAFVEGISSAHCALKLKTDNFIDTAFPGYKIAVDNRFKAIEVPGIVNARLGITATNTLQQVIGNQNSAITGIIDFMNINGVKWDTCFSVPDKPDTIAKAFAAVLGQICLVKSTIDKAITALPVFNNTNSCLTNGGPADSLVDTIAKIRIRLCLSAVFDPSKVNWGAVTPAPANDFTLQRSFQNAVDKIKDLSEKSVTEWNEGNFKVSYIDPAKPYLGKRVSVNMDGGIDTNKVKASDADTQPDYLDKKLQDGYDTGITVTPVYDSFIKRIRLQPAVDMNGFLNAMFDFIETNPEAKARLCAIVASCPVTLVDPGAPTIQIEGRKVAYYGYEDTGVLNLTEDKITAASSTEFTQDVTVSGWQNLPPQKLWLAVPLSEPAMVAWSGDGSGTIPDATFSTTIVGNYRVYMTTTNQAFSGPITFKNTAINVF